MKFAKLLRTPILKNICVRLLLAVGWRTTQKLSLRDLLLLTCLAYINISVASFFPSFIYDFLIHFDETKLTNGKLHGELQPVLKYYIKERDCIFRDSVFHEVHWQSSVHNPSVLKLKYIQIDKKLYLLTGHSLGIKQHHSDVKRHPTSITSK